MIKLKRLNGDSFTLNACMIEQIQSYPDTTITLINGKKIVVKEQEAEVVELITSFYKQVGIINSLSEVKSSIE
ncbi:flagellar FlbD family protein [Ornithinibacillus halotolerans]|uniref:Flagellar protein FlbD n=1 Tax=Ornithinibacillus halotolerans TaxID=1274357 RepID=A0A916W3F8_9BACI|nr:flagellar FlbD family protein [Ornithinibacillus halotolerans]GGA63021.1 hypothetical protein GCM10008025_03710 [Ornithinibacillus halotolerans]